jgi:hypothetical protein
MQEAPTSRRGRPGHQRKSLQEELQADFLRPAGRIRRWKQAGSSYLEEGETRPPQEGKTKLGVEISLRPGRGAVGRKTPPWPAGGV